jgi:predicted ATPase
LGQNIFEKRNFYVITGGPGVGKTTLLDAMEKEGFSVVPEVARKVIKEQQEMGGNALPWGDTGLYTKLMLKGSVESYIENAENENIIFFDRGILDTICYSDMIGNGISAEMDEYAKKLYNKRVFILPPWFEIYATDSERKQDWEEAEMTYHKMKIIYEKYGYDTIDVPRDSVRNRVSFVLLNMDIV